MILMYIYHLHKNGLNLYACCSCYRYIHMQAGIEVLLHDKSAYGECLQLYKELFTKQAKQVRFLEEARE